MRTPRFQEMRPSTGAYVCFYCESCNASVNSSPDVSGALANELKASLLRQIPILGSFFGGTAQAIDRDAHWKQVENQFAECAQCKKVVCRGCYDGAQQRCSRCKGDEHAKVVGARVGEAVAGMGAAAAGLGAALGGLGNLAQLAFIECPQCKGKTPRAPRCQNCGTAIPETLYKASRCSKCGQGLMPGAKFCPKCGGAATTA
jgi:hypothetical protein